VGVAGVLLTGGQSRRLGTPKAALRARGERLVDRAARVLLATSDPVIEVGLGYTDLPHAREEPAGEGPLAAFAAGGAALTALGHEGPFLVLAVDMPHVSEGLLAWLGARPGLGTVVPRVDGTPQTLCARYAPDAPSMAERLLDAGERSMRALLDAVTVQYVDEDEWGTVAESSVFDDVDTPADARRAGIHIDPG
jgi:molybdopterin-guanine dinucleotide biosynthesis protein A